MGETVAELQATLEAYREQLVQTEEFLAADPGGEEGLAIKAQVEAGIAATEQKLAAAKEAERLAAVAKFTAGAVAEAQFEDGQWYTVKILEISEGGEGGEKGETEGGAPRYHVFAIGFTHKFSVGVGKLRPWTAPRVAKGDFVEAVNPATGLFFPAKIDTISEKGTVWVSFKGDKKVEEVALTHVRPTRKAQAEKRPRKEPEAAASVAAAAGEDAAPRKKPRKENWKKQAEREAQEAAQSWKSFQKKAQKRQLGIPKPGARR